MKKHYFLITAALLASLFLYVFYRTEETVINRILIYLFSQNIFFEFKSFINVKLPLSGAVVYSLPGGLWVFAITLTSKQLFIQIGKHRAALIYLPLIFSIGIELLQLLKLSNGKFDIIDIIFYLLFWFIAKTSFNKGIAYQNAFRPFNGRTVVCLTSYLIVYLAHVWA